MTAPLDRPPADHADQPRRRRRPGRGAARLARPPRRIASARPHSARRTDPQFLGRSRSRACSREVPGLVALAEAKMGVVSLLRLAFADAGYPRAPGLPPGGQENAERVDRSRRPGDRGPRRIRGPRSGTESAPATRTPRLPQTVVGVMTNCEPGWMTMLPSAELVMVTLVRVALPRAPPMARMPAPLLDLSIRTLVMATFGMLPPPVLNWMPS